MVLETEPGALCMLGKQHQHQILCKDICKAEGEGIAVSGDTVYGLQPWRASGCREVLQLVWLGTPTGKQGVTVVLLLPCSGMKRTPG